MGTGTAIEDETGLFIGVPRIQIPAQQPFPRSWTGTVFLQFSSTD